MASVLKQELNYSTYQSKLLSTLNSLESSFKKSLDVSNDIHKDLNLTAKSLEHADKALTAIVMMTDKMERALSTLTSKFVSEFKNEVQSADKILSDYNISLTSSVRALDDHKKSIEGDSNALGKHSDRMRDSAEDIRVFNSGLQMATDFLMKIGSRANEYSQLSNSIIQISGMQGSLVRDFRAGIMDIVSDLNAATGNYYNPQQAYSTMAATMQGVTGNLEAMTEMARPVLLAQETLDVNISSIATLFNRFYTRYNFSTMSMEAMVGDIRKYSAGSAATGEDIVAAQESLKVYMESIAGGDEQRLTEYNEEIAKIIGFYENSGFNPNFIADFLKDIIDGAFLQNRSTLIALNQGGMTTDSVLAARNTPSQYDEIIAAYLRGIDVLYQQAASSSNLAGVLQNFEVDREFARDVNNLLHFSGIEDLNESFENYVATRDTTPLTEIVEDKYISNVDQINNWLGKIYSKLASFQEMTGIGFTDVATLIASISSLIVAGKTLQRLGGVSGALKSFGRGGVDTASKLGLGVSASQVASLGGIGLGAGLGYYGISQSIGDIKQGNYLAGSANALGGALGIGGAAAIGGALAGVGAANIWNPAGWAMLLASGTTLLTTSIVKAATKVGEVDAIEAAYDKAAKNVIAQSRENEDALLKIKAGLQTSGDLEIQRQELINSGILSETDRQELLAMTLDKDKQAYEENRAALIKLTEAYIRSTQDFSPEYEKALDDYSRESELYADKLKEALVEELEYLDKEALLKEGSEELGAADTLFYSIYKGLQDQKSSGIEFDKDTEKIYERLASAYEDNTLTEDEARKILNTGFWNTTFQNSNLGVENIVASAQKMSVANSAGSSIYKNILAETGGLHYYSTDETAYVVGEALKAKNATSREAAIELLDPLINSGYRSSMYKEIGEAVAKHGLEDYYPSYARGTNYIDSDQIALVHEGEAITPKKYNPLANLNELEALREKSRIDQENVSRDSRKVQQSLSETAEILQEIREFLSDWRTDNVRRETTAEIRNKFNRQRTLVNGYLPV